MREARSAGKYAAIDATEYVPLPAYDIRELQTPLSALNRSPRDAEAQRLITGKLFYSTRFMGQYDLDGGEWSGTHPGVDYKMPHGTPVRAIAGGSVHAIAHEEKGLGNSIIIEHRLPTTGERVFSIYGHLDAIAVEPGDAVRAGDDIGTVGQSGDATLPHLHLQIDRDDGSAPHHVYTPGANASRAEVMKHLLHPVDLIERY